MDQQDDESLESRQACVEVSAAVLPLVALLHSCLAPQPEPWGSLCSVLRDFVPRGQQAF